MCVCDNPTLFCNLIIAYYFLFNNYGWRPQGFPSPRASVKTYHTTNKFKTWPWVESLERKGEEFRETPPQLRNGSNPFQQQSSGYGCTSLDEARISSPLRIFRDTTLKMAIILVRDAAESTLTILKSINILN